MDPSTLFERLHEMAARHSHLCPRQVLGVRIGLAGPAAIGLDLPRRDKRLLVIVEADGCFVDGIEVATGCSVGHRTLRVEDYGKIAATFVDVEMERAVRVAPALDVRKLAAAFFPQEPRHYFAQLRAYQMMADEHLLTIQPVHLVEPIGQMISRAGVRVNCDRCGEEIINEREIRQEGQTLCRACAGLAYYLPGGISVNEAEPLRISKKATIEKQLHK
jgi:formylmethanofuran dehydrogenase subunit E